MHVLRSRPTHSHLRATATAFRVASHVPACPRAVLDVHSKVWWSTTE